MLAMYRELRYLFRVATSMKFNTTCHYWILKSRTSASLETHLDQFDSSFIDFTRINCKLIQYQPSKFSLKKTPFYHIRGLVIISMKFPPFNIFLTPIPANDAQNEKRK